jgi:6-phosphogluconolactonase
MKSIFIFLILFFFSSKILNYLSVDPENKENIFYVGSYTDNLSIFSFNNGNIKFIKDLKVLQNPSWLSKSNDGKFLFVVSEVNNFNGKFTGAISSYLINERNSTVLNIIETMETFGGSPCHVLVKNNILYISNYCSG